MHGLIFETSICYWQDQPGREARAGKPRETEDTEKSESESEKAGRAGEEEGWEASTGGGTTGARQRDSGSRHERAAGGNGNSSGRTHTPTREGGPAPVRTHVGDKPRAGERPSHSGSAHARAFSARPRNATPPTTPTTTTTDNFFLFPCLPPRRGIGRAGKVGRTGRRAGRGKSGTVVAAGEKRPANARPRETTIPRTITTGGDEPRGRAGRGTAGAGPGKATRQEPDNTRVDPPRDGHPPDKRGTPGPYSSRHGDAPAGCGGRSRTGAGTAAGPPSTRQRGATPGDAGDSPTLRAGSGDHEQAGETTPKGGRRGDRMVAGSPARSGGGGTRRETGRRRCARDGGGREGGQGRRASPGPQHTQPPRPQHKNAAAAAGPGRPPNRISSHPPGGSPPPPNTLTPGDRPDPTCPAAPHSGGPTARPRVGQTRKGEGRERKNRRRAGRGNDTDERGPATTTGAPATRPPPESASQGDPETASPGGDGARGVEPAGITLHTPRAVPPPRPRHRADPRPTGPREPRETPTRERPRRTHRRRPPETLERQRIPTSDDAPDAANHRSPKNVRPRGCDQVPQDTGPPGHRGGGGDPAISPGRGNTAAEGGARRPPHGPRAHTTRTTRAVYARSREGHKTADRGGKTTRSETEHGRQRRGTGSATTSSEAGTLAIKAGNAPGAPEAREKPGAHIPDGKGHAAQTDQPPSPVRGKGEGQDGTQHRVNRRTAEPLTRPRRPREPRRQVRAGRRSGRTAAPLPTTHHRHRWGGETRGPLAEREARSPFAWNDHSP
uniref:collagen alpha-1(I) chain-like n=1 Tax=Arvicanthis niloticus TaxID=61156 RepID=UPI0014860712|nr:collagen alpha-1(I) chain-like [Arvicanthis niloticus]